MVEINADTPCFVIESFYANGVAAAYNGRRDPNEGMEAQLRGFLTEVHNRLSSPLADLGRRALTRRPFVFSAFDDYPEDLGTTLYLMRLMQEGVPHGDIRFLSFYDLAIDAHGIPLDDNAYASALYRLHPMEILVDERTEDDAPLGTMFLDLYRAGSFAMMNPPEAILLQNKSFMALVYALARTGQLLTPEECALVERYLTPSYFEDDFDALRDGTYIRKEIWGREGKNVRLVEKRGGREEMVYERQPDSDVSGLRPSAALYAYGRLGQPHRLSDALVLHALRYSVRRGRTVLPRGNRGDRGILRPIGHRIAKGE